ncbi:sulfur carrier protein ThiS adenylyltransferase [Microbulbifer donghaiensis]|uniref:Sulfur carrier protein ThiS adenylyltransferase n=1 Tax=Microbulbifer donghaiensis TaxID=494016 RepID=A0A1M5H4N0_9GAMM|nr:HesA/MoeB/ThiF family protein [Microbulbifer donghaiensis]SHG10865.1 sulfur carrier protein ThiS adenylyltransferase [Microbulbifer donghaiensis]
MLSRKELQRYSRQIMLPEVGEEGQKKLAAARVMIVGLGGLGSPVALYLAAAGIGELHLVDGDHVDISNLQRQVLYKTNHRDKSKAQVAAQQLTAANPEIRIYAHPCMAEESWLRDRVPEMDLVLDCTDNLDIRHVINRVCREVQRPVIMASVQGFSGQLISFDFAATSSPCYACLFPPGQQSSAQNCSTAGVIGPALGVIGSMQALEAMKMLLGLPVPSRGKLHLFEAETLELRALQLQSNNDCPICRH